VDNLHAFVDFVGGVVHVDQNVVGGLVDDHYVFVDFVGVVVHDEGMLDDVLIVDRKVFVAVVGDDLVVFLDVPLGIGLL